MSSPLSTSGIGSTKSFHLSGKRYDAPSLYNHSSSSLEKKEQCDKYHTVHTVANTRQEYTRETVLYGGHDVCDDIHKC